MPMLNDPLLRAWFHLRTDEIRRGALRRAASTASRRRAAQGSDASPNGFGPLAAWVAFGALSLIWGSSFLWIKIAVRELSPLSFVAFRLTIGALALLGALRLLGIRLRPQRGDLPAYLALALFNTALPFALISWAETRIDSGLASILNGTVPLFTIVIAHVWLDDERADTLKLIGLLAGFFGVAVLLGGPDTLDGLLAGPLSSKLAMLAAALSYAFGLTLVRKRLGHERPERVASISVLLSGLLLWAAAAVFDRPLTFPRLPLTWIALVWLGLLGTATAYLLYYRLIGSWGSTRTSVVAYVMPVVGLILGVVFLGETVDSGLLLGSALVLGGVVFANRAPRPTQEPRLSEPVRNFLKPQTRAGNSSRPSINPTENSSSAAIAQPALQMEGCE